MIRYRSLLLTILALFIAAGSLSADDRGLLRWMRRKPAPPIKAIVLEGNEHFSDSRVRDQMYSRVRTAWVALKGDRRSRLQRETYGRDTLEIKYLYLNEGFLGIRVAESFEVIEPDSTARVRVRIDEGRRFVYGLTHLRGDFPSHMKKDIDRIAARLKAGDPVNYFTVIQAGLDIKTVLANHGYPYAVVRPSIDTALVSPLAPVWFEIVPDSIVRFGQVTIEGSDKYPEYTARRELKMKAGDLYRRQTIIESQRRLFESGYFSTLQLQQAPNQEDRYNPDFLLRVRERKTRFVTFTTGAGQSKAADLTWSLSGGVGKRNIFSSRRIDLLSRIEFSLGGDSRVTAHSHRVRYVEPWAFGIRMPLALTFEYQPRIQHEAQDFDVEQWSASMSTTKQYGRYTDATAGLEYRSVDISGVPEELEEAARNEVEDLSIRRRIYLTIIRDSRDHIFVPYTGSVRDVSFEYYGGFLGGDANFFKVEGAWSIYRQVWPGWVAASRVRIGYAEAFGDDSLVPSDDRLFLGGANSIRGFSENSLAPVLEDELPGANFTVLFNQEFRWKTLQIFQPVPLLNRVFAHMPLWQTIFFDMGNGFVDPEDTKLENLAYSYGTGVQIISPAGPIRLDYARRFKTKNIGFDDRWHFTILFAF